jgi:hypothetical protein
MHEHQQGFLRWWGEARPAREADILTYICEPIF